MDFRSCLAHVEGRGALKRVAGPVDLALEASRIARASQPLATLFENPGGMPFASGVASRETLCAAMGVPVKELNASLVKAMNAEAPTPLHGTPDFEESPGGFEKLPVLTYFRGDGGPYVTGAMFFAVHETLGPNVSWHRMMIVSDRIATVRVVEGRGLHSALEAAGGKLRVAACIGAPVQVMAAAAMPLPPGKDEMGVAGNLAATPVTEVGGFAVPAQSQIVIIGSFGGEEGDEGPFVDITGTRDLVRRQPVFELEKLFVARDAVFHAVIPAGPEHRFLMGFPREAAIFDQARKVCEVRGVRLTDGGCGWLHAVLSIVPSGGSDALEAGRAALRVHQSLKHVVVVDEDIDPSSPEQVEWAVATRFQAGSDLTVLEDEPSSSLDPSAVHEKGKRSRSSKMIVDATKKARGGPYDRVS